LAVAAAVLLLAIYGAVWLMPIFRSYLLPSHHTHTVARWLIPQFVIWGCVAAGIFFSMRRRKLPDETERMTPLVRRSPTTGLREL
jgi:hypothetical protein